MQQRPDPHGGSDEIEPVPPRARSLNWMSRLVVDGMMYITEACASAQDP